MRLIDADSLFKAYEKAAWYNNADRDEIAEEILLQMPTIEQPKWISCDKCEFASNCEKRKRHGQI